MAQQFMSDRCYYAKKKWHKQYFFQTTRYTELKIESSVKNIEMYQVLIIITPQNMDCSDSNETAIISFVVATA
jgi:hypothetical protein